MSLLHMANGDWADSGRIRHNCVFGCCSTVEDCAFQSRAHHTCRTLCHQYLFAYILTLIICVYMYNNIIDNMNIHLQDSRKMRYQWSCFGEVWLIDNGLLQDSNPIETRHQETTSLSHNRSPGQKHGQLLKRRFFHECRQHLLCIDGLLVTSQSWGIWQIANKFSKSNTSCIHRNIQRHINSFIHSKIVWFGLSLRLVWVCSLLLLFHE